MHALGGKSEAMIGGEEALMTGQEGWNQGQGGYHILAEPDVENPISSSKVKGSALTFKTDEVDFSGHEQGVSNDKPIGGNSSVLAEDGEEAVLFTQASYPQPPMISSGDDSTEAGGCLISGGGVGEIRRPSAKKASATPVQYSMVLLCRILLFSTKLTYSNFLDKLLQYCYVLYATIVPKYQCTISVMEH